MLILSQFKKKNKLLLEQLYLLGSVPEFLKVFYWRKPHIRDQEPGSSPGAFGASVSPSENKIDNVI